MNVRRDGQILRDDGLKMRVSVLNVPTERRSPDTGRRPEPTLRSSLRLKRKIRDTKTHDAPPGVLQLSWLLID